MPDPAAAAAAAAAAADSPAAGGGDGGGVGFGVCGTEDPRTILPPNAKPGPPPKSQPCPELGSGWCVIPTHLNRRGDQVAARWVGPDGRDFSSLWEVRASLFHEHASVHCRACGGGEDAAGNEILLCDGKVNGRECDSAYHLQCLPVPLAAIPEGDWLCPLCDASKSASFAAKKAAAATKGAVEAAKKAEAVQHAVNAALAAAAARAAAATAAAAVAPSANATFGVAAAVPRPPAPAGVAAPIAPGDGGHARRRRRHQQRPPPR